MPSHNVGSGTRIEARILTLTLLTPILATYLYGKPAAA
jgi:hypothetical protein